MSLSTLTPPSASNRAAGGVGNAGKQQFFANTAAAALNNNISRRRMINNEELRLGSYVSYCNPTSQATSSKSVNSVKTIQLYANSNGSTVTTTSATKLPSLSSIQTPNNRSKIPSYKFKTKIPSSSSLSLPPTSPPSRGLVVPLSPDNNIVSTCSPITPSSISSTATASSIPPTIKSQLDRNSDQMKLSQRSQQATSTQSNYPQQPNYHHHQQPICEAFIMTGQSMLKLSCNTSENNNNDNNNHNKYYSKQQTDPTIKVESEVPSSKNSKLEEVEEKSKEKEEIAQICESNKSQNGDYAPKQMSVENKVVVSSHECETDKSSSQGMEATTNSTTVATDTAVTDILLEKDVVVERPNTISKVVCKEQDEQLPSTPTSSSPIATDRDSARRLAKRLYNLSGFKRSDVCHHLSKTNPFSKTVAEEYLKLFDFRSMKLDSALRKFLSKLQLNGETQERERLLSEFSRRFYDCNKEKFQSADVVQTLVCALILLNTDLHGGHHKKKRAKLTLCAFIDGLNSSIANSRPSIDLHDSPYTNGIALSTPVSSSPKLKANGSFKATCGSSTTPYTFPRHLLVDLYESIKKRPLKCSGDDKCDLTSFEAELDKIYSQQQILMHNRSNSLPARRFVLGSRTMNDKTRNQLKMKSNSFNQQQDLHSSIEFKLGYLNRKRIFEANRKPTCKGRRGWRRMHVSLIDLTLMMRPEVYEEQQSSSGSLPVAKEARRQSKIGGFKLFEQTMDNSFKVHHAFAKVSTSYTKRQFVFHLQMADQSEFLFQANSQEDLNSWVDTINFACACLSCPALPNAIINCCSQSQRRKSLPNKLQYSRPILPVSYTRLKYWEQLVNHEDRLQRLKVELDEHLSDAPNTINANKRSKSEYIEKIAYLKQQIQRYSVYVDLMRKKSNSPEAIILSKHPEIASLNPSPEMIASLAPNTANFSNGVNKQQSNINPMAKAIPSS